MYKIGDKVETPLGVGILSDISANNETKYKVMYGTRSTWYAHDEIKPYRTAHEKLIEMGYEYIQLSEDEDDHYYELNDEYIWFSISEKNYRMSGGIEVDLELSRILTQYLEELEEK